MFVIFSLSSLEVDDRYILKVKQLLSLCNLLKMELPVVRDSGTILYPTHGTCHQFHHFLVNNDNI